MRSTVEKLLSLFVLLLFVGCGGGGGGGTASTGSTGSTSTGSTGNTGGTTVTASQTADVVLRFNLLARDVPNYVQEFRITGLSSSGDVLYGPVVISKRAEVTLSNVPTSVVRFRVEYLKNGAVRGVALIQVTLVDGETHIVDDPPFDDVAAVLSGLRLESTQTSVAAGFTLDINAFTTFNDGSQQGADGSVTWSSSDTDVATVDAAGLVQTKKPGQAVITAVLGNLSAQVTVTVTDAVLTGIKFVPDTLTLHLGTSGSYHLKAVFSDLSETDFTPNSVQSDDTSIATVSNGEVQTVGEGTTTIRAQFSNLEATLSVEVTAPELLRVEVQDAPAYFLPLTQAQLHLVGYYSDNTTQTLTTTTWISPNDSVASVDNTGLVSAKALGAVVMTATETNSGKQATAVIRVIQADVDRLEISPSDPWVRRSSTGTLTVRGYLPNNSYIDLTHSVVYSSDNPDKISVSNSTGTRGTFTGVSSGKANITAALPGTSLTASVKVRCLYYVQSGVMAVSSQVFRLLSSPDSSKLYALLVDKVLEIDPATRQTVWTYNIGGRAMALSPNGKYLLVGGARNSVELIDLTTNNVSTIALGDSLQPKDIDFLNDDTAFVLAGSYILVIDVSTKQQTASYPSQGIGIYATLLRVDPIGNQLFVAEKGLSPSSIYRYSLSGTTPTYEQSLRAGGNGQWLAVNPGKGLVFPCGGGNTDYGYYLTYYSNTNLNQSFGDFDIGTYPRNAEFSKDGDVLFAVNGDPYDPYLTIGRTDRVETVLKLTTPQVGGSAGNFLVEPSDDEQRLYLHILDQHSNSDSQIVFYDAK